MALTINQNNISDLYIGDKRIYQVCIGDRSIFPKCSKTIGQILSEKYVPTVPLDDGGDVDMDWIMMYSKGIERQENRHEEIQFTDDQQEYINQLANDLFGEEDDEADGEG